VNVSARIARSRTRRSGRRVYEQAWKAHLSSEAMVMQGVVTSFLALCLFSGCSLIMVGEPVKKQDLSTEDDAEENLKAIRKMLDDHATPPVEQSSGPSSQVLPSPSPVPSEGLSGAVEASPAHSVPPTSLSAGEANVPAKLPWTPKASQRPTLPDRQVPAYTTPAPVGPDYSGSIRCAPDGMGGQRCLGR
jgi:hypothetical protein